MLSHKILAPLVLLALIFLYLAWEVDPSWSKAIIPCLVAATLVYVIAPQINWWWWKRNPPELEAQLRDLPERFSLFYTRLSGEQKRRFRSLVFLHREGTDWAPMAWPEDEIPIDVKIAIAAQAATLTLNRGEHFLFEKFEKVIVYPKPFLSPEYPFPHASELFEPDGCLIFSGEEVLRGAANPKQFFNVALYEYARALRKNFPSEKLPELDDSPETWQKLEQVSGMSQRQIETTLGLTGADASAVAICHFFVFPERFGQVFPAENSGFIDFGFEANTLSFV